MTGAAPGKEAGHPLERFLRLFAPVKPGEGGTALLLAANVFLILTAYYLIKPAREALLQSRWSAEAKSYASAGQALLLLGIVPLYGSLASRLPRLRLITAVSLFFVVCLTLFALWARPGAPAGFPFLGLRLDVGIVFFIWVGIFNLMITAQFWAFANDVYTVEEGKRLFPIVAFGASLGAVLGSIIAREVGGIGVHWQIFVAGPVLLLALFLTVLVDRRTRRPRPTRAETPAAPAPAPTMGRTNVFRLVLGNPYILAMALSVLLLNWVNTNGEFILSRTLQETWARLEASGLTGSMDKRQFVNRFYADFFAVVNTVGLLAQLFLVSRLIRWFDIPRLTLALPLLALGSYTFLAFVPVLAVVRWVKTAENATDYSLNNTVRHALFLPLTREEKYKAKQAVDTIPWRMGDLLSAGLVFLGSTALHLGTRQYSLVNVGLVVGWVAVMLYIGREYRRRAERTP